MKREHVRSQIENCFRSEWEAWVVVLLAGWWYGTNMDGAIFMDGAKFARAGKAMLEGYMYGNPTHAHAPVAKYFLAISQAIFGPTTFGVKLPSVIFALGSIYVTYKLGVFLFSRRVGLLAMVALAGNPVFVRWTATAYLDVTFTFFVTLLLYTLVRWHSTESVERTLTLLLGALAVTTAATKLQGAIFAFAVVLGIAYSLYRRGTEGEALLDSAKMFVAGSIAASIVIYVPFLFSPHPSYYAGRSLPRLAQLVFAVPFLSNIVYAFGEAFAHNFGHISAGHEVTVAGETYTKPPFWSYLYWMADGDGVVPLVGLLGVSYFAIGSAVRPVHLVRKRFPIGVVAISVLVPFVLISLVSVKNPKYVLPLFPLLVVFASKLLFGVLDEILDRFGGVSYREAVSVTLALALLVSAPALGIATTVSEPPHSDSRYDDAAEYLATYAIEHEQEQPIRVVAGVPLPIRWYLGDTSVSDYSFESEAPKSFDVDGDGTPDLVLSGIGYQNATIENQTRADIQEGRLCFAVDTVGRSPPRNAEIRTLITSNSTVVREYPRTSKGTNLIIYRFDEGC